MAVPIRKSNHTLPNSLSLLDSNGPTDLFAPDDFPLTCLSPDIFTNSKRIPTNFMRDMDMLRCREFLRQAQRFAGKISNPQDKLAPDLAKKITEWLPDEKDRQRFYQLLSIYEHIPQSETEVILFIEDMDLLEFEPVIGSFDFLNRYFGYSFESGFIGQIKHLTQYEEITSRHEMNSLALVLRGVSSEEEADREKQWQQGLARIWQDHFNKWKESLKTGPGKKKVEEFQKKYPGPLSLVGILNLSSKKSEAQNIAEADISDLRSKLGPLFEKNEMSSILLSRENPEGMAALVQMIQNLKFPRSYEPITPELLQAFSEISDLPDFLAFWNWYEATWAHQAVRLGKISRMEEKWEGLRKSLGNQHQAWSDETVNRILEVVMEFGFEGTASTSIKLQKDLEDFYWNDQELEALRRFKAVYPAMIHPSENTNVGLMKATIQKMLSKSQLEVFLDPDNLPLYRAAAKHEYNEKKEVDNLSLLPQVEQGIQFFEEKIPHVRSILRVLAKSGVPLHYLTIFEKNDSPEDSELQLSGTYLSILKGFSANPDALNDWVKASELYHWDEFSMSDLLSWMDLSAIERKSLLETSFSEAVHVFQQTYQFVLLPSNALALRKQIDSDQATKENIKLLLSPACQTFYQKYQGYFEEMKYAIEDFQENRLWGIARFYQRNLRDPKMLRWAKRWNDLGQKVDTYFASDEAMKELPVLDHPDLPRLARAIKKIGMEVEYLSEVKLVIKDVRILEKTDFQNFAMLSFEKFDFPHSFLSLDELVEFYKNSEARASLYDPQVQAYYQKLKEYGFKMDKGPRISLEQCYQRFLALYQNPRLFEAIDKLEKSYSIDIKKQIRAAERNGEGLFNLGFFEKTMSGIETREFDFILEFKTLHDTGDLALLLDPKTVELVHFLENTHQYEFKLLDVSSLLTVVKSERLSKWVCDPRLKRVMDQIGLGFDFSFLDAPISIMENEAGFQEITKTLNAGFQYYLDDLNDLVYLSDLLGRDAVLEKLKSKEVREVFEKLREDKKYKFRVNDLYALIYLADHPGLVDKIYDPSMEEVVETVFGKIFRNDLEGRIQFEMIYREPENREKLVSDEFRAIRNRVSQEIRVLGGIDSLEGYLSLMDHPEVFDFLKAIDFKLGHQDFRAYGFFDAIPGLVKLAEIHAEKHIQVLQKEIEKNNEQLKQQGKVPRWYTFHPLDGPAWESLVSRYPDPKVLAEKVIDFATRLGVREITTNDIYLELTLQERISWDRAGLQTQISQVFAEDVHRVDSNFDSYQSYNDVSKFNLMDLNEMSWIQLWLETPEARQKMGALIHQDVKDYPFSELGFVLVLNPDASLELREHPPEINFFNGSYLAPQEAKNEYGIALGIGHLHALKFKQQDHAGPSGSRFSIGGDMTVAQVEGRNALVVTSLSKKEFCVHFYTPEGHVAFLGRYAYEPPAELWERLQYGLAYR